MSRPWETEQLELQFHGREIWAHGLRALHPRPMVGGHTESGEFWSRRTSREQAFMHELIGLQDAGAVYATMTLDCDNLDRLGNLADLPPCNFRTRTPSGGSHVTWCFATPVHKHPNARRAPLEKAAWVERWFESYLGADPGYTHTLTYNPLYDAEITEWGALSPWELDQLASVVPANWNWRQRRLPDVGEIGPHRTVFRKVQVEAGRRLRLEPDADLLAIAFQANRELQEDGGRPRSDSDLRHIAKSVAKQRVGWLRDGHTERFRARQATRGRNGGRKNAGKVKRGRVRSSAAPAVTNEAARPWEAFGTSRRTYYRRDGQRWSGTELRYRWIRKLRAEGRTYREIAAAVGCGAATVRRALAD